MAPWCSRDKNPGANCSRYKTVYRQTKNLERSGVGSKNGPVRKQKKHGTGPSASGSRCALNRKDLPHDDKNTVPGTLLVPPARLDGGGGGRGRPTITNSNKCM